MDVLKEEDIRYHIKLCAWPMNAVLAEDDIVVCERVFILYTPSLCVLQTPEVYLL